MQYLDPIRGNLCIVQNKPNQSQWHYDKSCRQKKLNVKAYTAEVFFNNGYDYYVIDKKEEQKEQVVEDSNGYDEDEYNEDE
jgi:hypothetical protein